MAGFIYLSVALTIGKYIVYLSVALTTGKYKRGIIAWKVGQSNFSLYLCTRNR